MYVVVNHIPAAAHEIDRMVEAFRKSVPDLKQFDGYLGMELWREEGMLLAVSKWRDREAFLQYPRSEVFKEHHKGMGGEEASRRALLRMYEGEVVG
jgi:heme-degrading monooxygenase HmoA